MLPEIMVPLVAHQAELASWQGASSTRMARGGARRRRGTTIDYLVGTMIELPRAALRGRRDRARPPSSSPSAPTI